MVKTLYLCATAALLASFAQSFILSSSRRSSSSLKVSIEEHRDAQVEANDADEPKWPGNRLPAMNPLLLEQRMDATWGRGKFRTEIWEDDVNPRGTFWWEAYAPSEETIQALRAGFNFNDPKKWCEDNGLDYEKAAADAITATKKHLAQLKAQRKPYSDKEFKKAEKRYFELLQQRFELGFRKEDDEKQALKGQPSLENEDTGIQWKNDEE